MADPRIARTKDHLISAAKTLLTNNSDVPLTFKQLSETTKFNQKTIRNHWPTIEDLLIDAAGLTIHFVPTTRTGSSRARLRHFLSELRSRLSDPIVSSAYAMLIARATYDRRSADLLNKIACLEFSQFNSYVADASQDQYSMLVAPLFFSCLISHNIANLDVLENIFENACNSLAITNDGGDLVGFVRE